MSKDTTIKLNASIRLIQFAAEQKIVKPLSVYYMLKARFRNSCIYCHRSRNAELANFSGISEKTLYTYKAQLSENGLCYEHAGNLILTSTRAIKLHFRDRRKTILNIGLNDSLEDIETRLYGKLLERHALKIAFRESLRRFISRDNHIREFDENDCYKPSLSIPNTAKVLSLGIEKTARVLKRLNDLKVISSEHTKPERLKRGTVGFKRSSFENLPGHFFKTKYGTFRVFGTKHCFNEYPVKVKKLTIQQYIKATKSETCKKQ
jgi:hypothetical protein